MEALTIVHHVPDYPIVDEIRGVKEFHSTRQVPLFLTFGVEITLDIHHVVGGYAEITVTALLERLGTMKGILQSHMEFHENLKSPHWSSSDERAVKASQELLRCSWVILCTRRRRWLWAGTEASETQKQVFGMASLKGSCPY